jgi:hypothetical protein
LSQEKRISQANPFNTTLDSIRKHTKLNILSPNAFIVVACITSSPVDRLIHSLCSLDHSGQKRHHTINSPLHHSPPFFDSMFPDWALEPSSRKIPCPSFQRHFQGIRASAALFLERKALTSYQKLVLQSLGCGLFLVISRSCEEEEPVRDDKQARRTASL